MGSKKKQQSKRLAVSRRRRSKPTVETKPGWFSRHPVLVFLFVFGLLMGLFYAMAIFTPIYKKHFLVSYLPFNARVSGALLGLLGHDITVAGASISSPAFSVTVDPGCDGIEPIALFVCAVLAFPAPFRKKLPGIVSGSVLLAILNFVRVITLFLVGVYWPRAFRAMHIEVWQAMFIFFAVLFWIIWLLWAMRTQTVKRRA
jgi:exosortase/archaeosortase family protein